MNWWAEDTKRAIREQRALGQLAERSSWLTNPIKRLAEGMRVAFDFDVQIGDRTIPLTLVYPDLFPDAAPGILPRTENAFPAISKDRKATSASSTVPTTGCQTSPVR